jgi:hypothetical protein
MFFRLYVSLKFATKRALYHFLLGGGPALLKVTSAIRDENVETPKVETGTMPAPSRESSIIKNSLQGTVA